jgi:hypothetical protein
VLGKAVRVCVRFCVCVGFDKGCCLCIFFALLAYKVKKGKTKKAREGAKEEEKREMGKKPPFAFLAK